MATEFGSATDESDMRRMGMKQDFRRNFNRNTLTGFGILLGNGWAYTLIGSVLSLQNGGPAGGIWMLCFVLCGMGTVTLSLAELASMYPTSGAQYYWVGQLAPKNSRKLLSYCVAWLSFIGWQVGMAGTCFSTGEQIRGFIALVLQSYEPEPFRSVLLCMLVATISVIWNTRFAKMLPNLEGCMLLFYFLGYVAFMSVLLVMGPRSDPKTVFSGFKDQNEWGNTFLATLVGILASIFTLESGDSASHLAEEVKDASRVQPKAMVIAFLVSGVMALSMTIVNFLCQGNDYAALLDTSFGQPWIQTLLDATGSTSITASMVGFVCLLLQVGCINQTTTTSRQAYALARDKILPYSAKLFPASNGFPRNSVLLTWTFTMLMSLVPLFSPVAFNIIVSLSMLSLYSSYLVTIICSAWKRFFGGGLPCTEFPLGKASICVNSFAILYLSIAIVFLCFPSSPSPSLVEMNWACVMFTSAVLFSLLYYYFSGRRSFEVAVSSIGHTTALGSTPGVGDEVKLSHM